MKRGEYIRVREARLYANHAKLCKLHNLWNIGNGVVASHDIKQKHHQNFNYGNFIRRINPQKACSEWIVWSRSVFAYLLLVRLDMSWYPWILCQDPAIGITGTWPLIFPGPKEALGNHSSRWYLSSSGLKKMQVKRLIIVKSMTAPRRWYLRSRGLFHVRPPKIRQVQSDSFHCHKDRAC